MSLWPRRTAMALGASLVIGSFLGAAKTSSGADAKSTVPMAVTPADADSWTSYHGTSGNTAALSGSNRFPAPETVVWEYDQDGDVVVADGTVYLRTGAGIHALSASDRSIQWVREDVGADGTPAVVDDTVYVAGDRVTALDAGSGDTVWSTSFGTDGQGQIPSPTIVDGSIYVVVDGALRSLDADDGTPRWRRSAVDLERRDVDVASFASIPVAVANDLVYAVADAGFVALDAESGKTVWTVQEQTRSGNDVRGSIVATEDRLYVAWMGDDSDGGNGGDGDDGDSGEWVEEEKCLVLDADDGELLERIGLRFPLAATDTVRVSAERHGVYAYNYETDHSWTVGGSIDAWGRPSIGGRTVVVPYHPVDGDPAIFGVDIETGLEQWSFPLAAVGLDAAHEARWPDLTYVIGDGTVYLSGHGSLVALEPATEVGADETGANEDDAVGTDTMDGDDADDENGSRSDEEFASDDIDVKVNDDNDSPNDSSNATETKDPSNATDTGNEKRQDDTDGTAFDETGHEMDGVNDAASDEEDGAPGFTVGTGLVSGGLALEWLRRRLPANNSEQ
ncbi:PQQ-binding-like beta-propeller repeat protein [Natronosalvus halobius]|uniref:outer membrane protein assembly factor BamB family protein n=1 Tax=Natronosalvus halobius TaxID=2953746 RepID=UPI0020A0E4E8|nr:PQQ-binding-like beta-propeller repeat protein [Natronosalvus halobius]USZ72349.1 PQQ-binding-like beta-propeller repeat protein [Natronosalvus halobius]